MGGVQVRCRSLRSQVPQLFPPRPNDTYARLESDNRPIFRGIHPRPKEAYRKPPRDVGRGLSGVQEVVWHGHAAAEIHLELNCCTRRGIFHLGMVH